MDKIDIAEGKYTLLFDKGEMQALRYGAPWRDVTGDNLIYWMWAEIEKLKAKIEKMEGEVL